MIRISAPCKAWFTGLAGILAATVPGSAQQPMVFVHGGLNDGSAWMSTSNFLRSQFSIQPLLPTLGWTDRFVDQETRLHSAIAPYTGIPALAHSNGGLASREHVRMRGSASSINRLATIGTPHTGLQLANNALGGNLVAWGQTIVASIGDPIAFYANWDPNWWLVDAVGLDFAARNMARLGNNIPLAVLSGIGVGAAVPVTGDLRPGDGFLTGLNSAQALGVESSVLSARVGIGTMTRPENAMMRLLLSNWRDWTDVRWSLWSFAITMSTYYANHSDYYLRSNSWRWDLLAIRMMDLDVVWQWQIGALAYAECAPVYCHSVVYASDGLVRLSNQTYPGGTRQLTVSGDIVHTQQKNAPAARNVFVTVLRDNFGVPAVPPPPPALSVTIGGLTTIKRTGTYSWSASATGGSGTYTYTWEKREGNGPYYWVGSGPSYSEYVARGGPPSVTFRVTAASGAATGQATKQVNNLIP